MHEAYESLECVVDIPKVELRAFLPVDGKYNTLNQRCFS